MKTLATATDTTITAEHVSVLDKSIVLVLNKSWIAIGVTSPRKALVSLMGGDNDHPVCALDLSLDSDGNLIYADPVDWDTWKTLDVRAEDFYIQTARNRVRCPTVIITKNFNKVPMKKPRVCVSTIAARDGGKCQYTGKTLTRKQMSLDHVQPRSRGGRDTFENLVLADRAINTFKADRTPQEAGLKLLRVPKAPPSLPSSATIGSANHSSWTPFLMGGQS